MFEKLVSAHTKGNLMIPLLWTNKSFKSREKGLAEKDYQASYKVVDESAYHVGLRSVGDKNRLRVSESHADREKQGV
ncbi:hypothetical protein Holit_00680 [Hollandina sp. SP2]